MSVYAFTSNGMKDAPKVSNYRRYFWEFNSVQVYKGLKIVFGIVAYQNKVNRYDMFVRPYYKNVSDGSGKFIPIPREVIDMFVPELGYGTIRSKVVDGIDVVPGLCLEENDRIERESENFSNADIIRLSAGYMMFSVFHRLIATYFSFSNSIHSYEDAVTVSALLKKVEEGDEQLAGYGSISMKIDECDMQINNLHGHLNDAETYIRTMSSNIDDAKTKLRGIGFNVKSIDAVFV